MLQIPKPDWEHNLEITAKLRKKLGGRSGVSATYSKSVGLALVVRRRWIFFLQKTVRHPAALCTPAIAANVINQVGLGDYHALLAIIGASNEVTIQRGPDGKIQFIASGTLSK